MVAARAPGPGVSARAEVLARIRAANAAGTRGVPAGPVGRAYRQRGELDPAQLLGLLAGADRLPGAGAAHHGGPAGR